MGIDRIRISSRFNRFVFGAQFEFRRLILLLKTGATHFRVFYPEYELGVSVMNVMVFMEISVQIVKVDFEF
jgi:hypothetical protein